MKRKSKIALSILLVTLLLFIASDGIISASRGENPIENLMAMDMLKGFLGKFEDSLKYLEEPPIFPGFAKNSNSLVVTSASFNVDWSEIDKKNSTCTLPEGKISAGDTISDCRGTVILVYTPAEQTIGIWEFTSSKKNTEQDEKDPYRDNENNNETDEDENIIIPKIMITKPQINSFYILNNKKFNTHFTRIIGDIDIETEIKNTTDVNVSFVKFYINDEYTYKDEEAPFMWNWNEKLINKKCTIKVVAYNKYLGELSEDEISVAITNFGIV